MACHGRDLLSRSISWGTASLVAPRRLRVGPSHVALIAEYHGSPLWVESTTMCNEPCVIRRHQAQGVQAHLIDRRINEYIGNGGRIDLYRLTPIERLSSAESELLTKILLGHFLARNTEYDTGGAMISGTRLFKFTRLLAADLNKVFCSELIAACLMRLGRLNRSNPTRFNPACLLRQLFRQGTIGYVRSYKPD
jgi:hypothetical protein